MVPDTGSRHPDSSSGMGVPKLSGTIPDRILQEAQDIAGRYSLTIEADPRGEYIAKAAELPGVTVRENSLAEAERQGRQALVVAVATMLEVGAKPPAPMIERRTQVNVRLSGEERIAMARGAKLLGFDNLSEFVRVAALEKAAAARSKE